MSDDQGKRLKQYAVEYAEEVWGEAVDPSPEEQTVMGVRADMYANAHVQSGCACGLSPEECGERYAAEEYVEAVALDEPEPGPRYPADGVSPLDW